VKSFDSCIFVQLDLEAFGFRCQTLDYPPSTVACCLTAYMMGVI
jgi:hypothetical protein